MKTQTARNRAFTLTELLVAAALSSLVLAMFLTLLVKSLGLWRDGLARLQLSEHSRLTRERVLHGIDGRFGLRHASRSQLSVATNRIAFREVSTNATNAFLLLFNAGQPPVYSNAAGRYRLFSGRTFVDRVALATNGNILNIELTLALTNGWKKYSQSQSIRVYLLNP